MSDSTVKTIAADGEKVQCEKHNAALIPEESYELLGQRFTIPTYCPACEEADRATREQEQHERAFRRQQDLAGVPPRFKDASVDSFIANTPREQAVKTELLRYCDSGGRDPVNLILTGKLGSGKSHAGAALINDWLRSRRSARFCTALGLVRRIRDTWGSKERENSVVNYFVTAGLLVVDEIGQQSGSPNERALLADVINGRYEQMKSTIVIGNLTSAEFAEILGERATSRLQENGRTLVFDWASRRGKV